jgi:hypothetical protein
LAVAAPLPLWDLFAMQCPFDCGSVPLSDFLSDDFDREQAGKGHRQREKKQCPKTAPRFAPSLMLGILLPSLAG